MKPPSEARKRTLALQDRALRFSAGVNKACPSRPPDIPSETVWERLTRAADSVSNNLEREAGELSAIFATIVIKVSARLERERSERTDRKV